MNDLGGFTDPSTSGKATQIATHRDVSRPVRADGKKLSRYGVYGDDTVWQEWSFGDTAVPAAGAALIFGAGFGFLACQRRNKKRA